MRSSVNQLEKFKNKTVAVIGGGISNERDVSLRSAANVLRALKELGLRVVHIDPAEASFFDTEFDIAFNCLHGKWGEDGGLQGYCELRGIPYTGPGILATSIGLNKPFFKHILKQIGLPVPTLFKKPNQFPLVAKPISEGSSIGIHIVKSEKEFTELASQNPPITSDHYFFEEYISGKEVTSGVIKIADKVIVLPILELETTNEFYDFDAKYSKGKTTFILPANISNSLQAQIESISKEIYNYFNCKGCTRIDFMIKDNEPYVLEMNTNPGLTELSDIPAQAKAMGMDFNQLMIHYLESAI
ncbi:MAG: D-alanine--D-alanine ligase [Candidatus Margulisiibacteriota bacterium]|nr:D-alanine--D-alanine ligase [Candidatus Margulisiibacteriota bacterium]